MWAVSSSPLVICCIWPRNTDHLMNESVQFGSTFPSPSKVDHTRRAALAVWWPWRKLWTLRVHAHSRMCFWGVHWRPLDVSQLGKTPLQRAAFANTKLVPGSLECCGIRDGMGPHGRQTMPQQAWCIWCRGVRGGNRYWENHITPVLV